MTSSERIPLHSAIRPSSFEQIVKNLVLENPERKELDLPSKISSGFCRILVQFKILEKHRFSQNPKILVSPTKENVSDMRVPLLEE